VLLLTLSPALAAPPGDDAAWESLTNKPVPIRCVKISDVPWCRSQGVIAAKPAEVAEALEGMKAGSNAFESVVSVRVLAPDTVHVVLDYPWPLTDRDYVAKYSRSVDGDVLTYSWVPVAHADAPVDDDVVRLPHFEGTWRLEPSGDGTLVTYTWNAEIAGSFPSSGYNTAWKKAGHEALKDLANTRGAALTAPAE
jgi:hypothetical protein